MIRSLAEARDTVRAEPTRFRACVYEATGTPVTERDDTLVHLYCLKGTAQEKFRERIRVLEADGYVRDKSHTLGSGLAKLVRGDSTVWLVVGKR